MMVFRTGSLGWEELEITAAWSFTMKKFTLAGDNGKGKVLLHTMLAACQAIMCHFWDVLLETCIPGKVLNPEQKILKQTSICCEKQQKLRILLLGVCGASEQGVITV